MTHSAANASPAAAPPAATAAAAAVAIEGLGYRYGERVALEDVSFTVGRGEIFGLLGPNGSGKTTLFRILSTLIRPQTGRAVLLGHDLASDAQAARLRLGVVFQAPSLDKKLTAEENLRHQGHLYGLHGAELTRRVGEMLERFGLAGRTRELTEKMSGGQRRRVELAKGLLHRPELLLLDEPSTGLDPGARRELMRQLRELSAHDGVTCLLTTHLMEEADDCARLAILNHGRLVALDTPDALKGRIGGQVVTLAARDAEGLAGRVREKFGGEVAVLDGKVRLEREDGHRLAARLVEAFPGEIETVAVSKPTLEDVFIRVTGRRFWEEGESDGQARRD